MSSPVVTVEVSATVAQAARAMREHGVGSVLIEDDGLAGILTTRDLAYKVAAEGLDPTRLTVAEVMSSPVLTVEPAAHIDDAVAKMLEHGTGHLAVVLEGELQGILTVSDIAHEHEEIGRRLRAAQATGWET